MAKPVIYTCGAVDEIMYCDAFEWRDQAKKELEKWGFKVLNILDEINLTLFPNITPEEINHNAVSMVLKSDLILANLTHDVKYCGTVSEITIAGFYENIPVVAFGAAIEDKFIEPWITIRLETLEDAIDYITCAYEWLV